MAEDVERSSGSPAHDVLSIPWEDQVIHRWHPHPSAPGAMLCSLNRDSEQFKCHAIDLADGGVKPKARYLGHGGEIESFSTSKGDTNLFVTSADDGYVRVFDQRHPLPIRTIRGGSSGSEAPPCAALCHPDGLPCKSANWPLSP
jgi:WD40 repeat protein